MPNNRSAGFTLGELLLSSALAVLTLALTTALMLRVIRYSQRLDDRDERREATQYTLRELTRICRTANRWTLPAVNDNGLKTSMELEFPHLSQELARWPDPSLPVPPLPAWNPRHSSRQVRMRFYVTGRELHRSQTLSGVTTDHLWAQPIQGLSVQRVNQNQVQLTLTYPTRQGLQQAQATTSLPLARALEEPLKRGYLIVSLLLSGRPGKDGEATVTACPRHPNGR